MTGIRSKQRVATRERILATARNLFLQSSFEQVGVRDIAAEAGVATGTVIAAFGSKGDLLHAIVVEDLSVQLPLMEAAAALYHTTHDRLMASCKACVAYQASQIAILRASMADAWTRTDEAESRIRIAVRPLFLSIAGELDRGAVRGEVLPGTDIKLAAQMIFETVINSYRIPIYGDCKIIDLLPLLEQRLALLLRAICLPAEQTHKNDVYDEAADANQHDVAA